MSVYILKIIGIAIVTGVMAVAGVFYLGASKLEEEIEIETENRGSKEK
jgi:hypothetical protein